MSFSGTLLTGVPVFLRCVRKRHFDVVACAVLEDPGYGPGGNLRAFHDAFA